jgi:hypothetical protein
MLVVRNVQYAAVYVGLEHWRHLHSWPCDRNRNEGSSQQHAGRALWMCVHAVVTKRKNTNKCHQVACGCYLLGNGRMKYRNRVSAASGS